MKPETLTWHFWSDQFWSVLMYSISVFEGEIGQPTLFFSFRDKARKWLEFTAHHLSLYIHVKGDTLAIGKRSKHYFSAPIKWANFKRAFAKFLNTVVKTGCPIKTLKDNSLTFIILGSILEFSASHFLIIFDKF